MMGPMRRALLSCIFVFLFFPIPGSAGKPELSLFPDLSVSRLDQEGKSLKISSFRGRPVLMSFWATWCGPCRQEVPELIRAEQEIEGFVFLPVSVDSSPSSVRSFFSSRRIEHPVYSMSRNDLKMLGVRSLPSTLVLDAEGRVVLATTGYSRNSLLKIRRMMKRLIKESGEQE